MEAATTPAGPVAARAALEAKEAQLAALRSEILELRRQAFGMPLGDYTLHTPDGAPLHLSEAFGDRDQLVLIHNMGRRCPYCTMWADGFNSLYRYVQRRAAFVLVNNDPPEVLREFAQQRGWTFATLSAAGTTLFADLGFQQTGEDGSVMDWPGVSTLVKNADGSLSRCSAAVFGPGDEFNSAWHFFDLLAVNDESIEPTEGM